MRITNDHRNLSTGIDPDVVTALGGAIVFVAALFMLVASVTPAPSLLHVERVIDGDTVQLEHVGTVRLLGVDTPETVHPRKPVQCFGPESSHFMKGLLANARVRVELAGKGRYGRALGYLYREDGLDVNIELVRRGYSKSYRKYRHERLDEFNEAEKEPRRLRLGVWSCGDN